MKIYLQGKDLEFMQHFKNQNVHANVVKLIKIWKIDFDMKSMQQHVIVFEFHVFIVLKFKSNFDFARCL